MDNTYDPITEGLNDEQRAAVLQTEGPVLVIAGAGSGKTRVLTSRIAHILQKGTPAENILALTFTRKAAGEMKQRICSMVGPIASRLVMGTFHSVFIRFLRQYHEMIGFPQGFTIYDDDDSASCVKDCIREVLFGTDWKEKSKALDEDGKKRWKEMEKDYDPKSVKGRISAMKNDLVDPNLYGATPSLLEGDRRHRKERFLEIYRLYMNKCYRAGAMDYDDILLYMNYLLRTYPAICTSLGTQFRYILVDEYQDTNAAQYSIIKLLASVHRNICAVGDDSQSIYAFRGARIANILSFREDYRGCKEYKLVTNYRSTAAIVDAANALIEHNSERLPKTCRAAKGEGKAITLEECRDDRKEASFIACRIASGHGSGNRPYSDYAVLYRTNAQSRILEDTLIRMRIPYVIYSGLSFFQRAEVKDVLAYFRLVTNFNDDEAFKRICNKPARGISDNTLGWLSSNASLTGESLFLSAGKATSCGGISTSGAGHLQDFTSMIRMLHQSTEEMDACQAAKEILSMSGIYEFYKAGEKDTDEDKRTANIDELMNGVAYFVEDRTQAWVDEHGSDKDMPKVTLTEYIENVALLSNADTGGDSADKVSLMTAHCAKGLEFKTVFVTGVEEKLFPMWKDMETDEEIEEERRLFYVAVTRAQDELILTHCRTRRRFNDIKDMKKSRFIKEMAIEEEEQ